MTHVPAGDSRGSLLPAAPSAAAYSANVNPVSAPSGAAQTTKLGAQHETAEVGAPSGAQAAILGSLGIGKNVNTFA